MQLRMVVATSEPVLLTLLSRDLAKTSSIPVFSMIPPKDKAQIIKATVGIMLKSPPLVSKSSTMVAPV